MPSVFLADSLPNIDMTPVVDAFKAGATNIANTGITMATSIAPYVIGVAGVSVVIGLGVGWIKSIRK